MPRVALFDMDRTLVREHTSRLFTQYQRERGEVGPLRTVRVAYWLALYTLGIVDAPTVARVALAGFKGVDAREHRAHIEEWFPRYVAPHISDEGRRIVEQHRAAGDHLAIVTGASRYVTEPLARVLDIEHLVCTDVLVGPDGRFTGEAQIPLAFGEGKRALTFELLGRLGVRAEAATFYTDSITDLPLLEAVGRPIVVNPDYRLRRQAERRGWPVRVW